jgi:hypothetical protein
MDRISSPLSENAGIRQEPHRAMLTLQGNHIPKLKYHSMRKVIRTSKQQA